MYTLGDKDESERMAVAEVVTRRRTTAVATHTKSAQCHLHTQAVCACVHRHSMHLLIVSGYVSRRHQPTFAAGSARANLANMQT